MSIQGGDCPSRSVREWIVFLTQLSLVQHARRAILDFVENSRFK
jgi:hypothetical protein